MTEMPTEEQFVSLVSERTEGGTVVPTVYELARGNNVLQVRAQGAYIIECKLEDDRGSGVPVLHGPRTPEELQSAKLNASHTMLPVGPYGGVGGQHGFDRWANHAGVGTDVPHFLAFEAQVPEDYPQVQRQFDLEPGRLVVATTVTNTTAEDLRTSMGEHFYFELPGEQAEGLQVNGYRTDRQEVTDLAEIMRGETRPVSGYRGVAFVTFPDGRRLQISSRVFVNEVQDDMRSQEVQAPLGLYLWHRQGDESICIEPTVGCTDEGAGVVVNDLLRVVAGTGVTFETEITLLSGGWPDPTASDGTHRSF